jgi:hypothetical protein
MVIMLPLLHNLERNRPMTPEQVQPTMQAVSALARAATAMLGAANRADVGMRDRETAAAIPALQSALAAMERIPCPVCQVPIARCVCARQAPHLRCPRCSKVGRIVNECGCDPDNMPTPCSEEAYQQWRQRNPDLTTFPTLAEATPRPFTPDRAAWEDDKTDCPGM